MKLIKTIRYAVIAIVFLTISSVLWIFLPDSGHRIAANGNRIGDAIHYELPDYVVTSSDDNMERNSSAWDNYEYTIQFKNPKDIPAMENDMLKLCEKGGHWVCTDSIISYKAVNGEWDDTIDARFATSNSLTVYFYHEIGTNEAYVSYYIYEIF